MASNLVKQLVDRLGEGWACESEEGNDGYITGPGGERFWVDLRGIVSPDTRHGVTVHLYSRIGVDLPEQFEKLDATTVEEAVAAVREKYPIWAQAHHEDTAKVAALIEGPSLFAQEVASHLGKGWTGGAEDSYRDRDRFSPVAYVTNGKLRVEWSPLFHRYGYYVNGILQPGGWRPVEKLELHGHRDQWPAGIKRPATINVSASRPAKQVAGEIKRRLLPDYEKQMAKADAEDQRKTASVAGAMAMAEVVTASLGKLASGNQPRDYPNAKSETQAVRIYHSFGEVHLSGDVSCYATSSHVDLRIGGLDSSAAKIVFVALREAIEKIEEGK